MVYVAFDVTTGFVEIVNPDGEIVVGYDASKAKPFILRCTEDDGDVRLAVLATETEEACRDVLERVFGFQWARGDTQYPSRFSVLAMELDAAARRAGVSWYFDGGDTCKPVEKG